MNPHLAPQQRLSKGAKILANLVGLTYGPSGQNVLIQRFSGLLATKDGVTVTREAGSSDCIADAAIAVIRDACLRVEERSGDGTTTTALLASVIFHEAQKLLVSGVNPVDLGREMEDAAHRVIHLIESLVLPVPSEDILLRVAMIASKGDTEVSEAIAKAVSEIGDLGAILVQDGYRMGIETEFREGLVVNSGWSSWEMENWRGGSYWEDDHVKLEGALVAVFSIPLNTVEDIKSVLETATQWPENPLVIVAPRVTGMALKTLRMNASQRSKMSGPGSSPWVTVQTREMHRDRMDDIWDIAAITASMVVDPAAGNDHKDFNPAWFGSCRYAYLSEKKSEFIMYQEPRFEEALETRLKALQRRRDISTSDYDSDRLSERIAALDGGLCILRVASATEMENKERKARIEDTLLSVQAAAREGVVPGAGSAYTWASQHLEGNTFGAQVIKKALLEPAKHLIENTGNSGPLIIDQCREPWVGFDIKNSQVRDLMNNPVIVDSLSSVREPLLAAVSAATMLLTTEVFVPYSGQK